MTRGARGAATFGCHSNCIYSYDSIPMSNCSNGLFDRSSSAGTCLDGACTCNKWYTGVSDWVNLDGNDCHRHKAEGLQDQVADDGVLLHFLHPYHCVADDRGSVLHSGLYLGGAYSQPSHLEKQCSSCFLGTLGTTFHGHFRVL